VEHLIARSARIGACLPEFVRCAPSTCPRADDQRPRPQRPSHPFVGHGPECQSIIGMASERRRDPVRSPRTGHV